MELSRRTIQRMILRKSGETTVINQGSEGGGGGSQPSVALGPLLTSLNSEAMPSAEGYLHWTGSAWAFDTPTGGDPVDLTPYALKTWVQDNFAYKNDLVNFITKTEADGYYAALSHTHANYLPLSAGANKALTGSLYFSGNSGIYWAGGVGMLACTPESGWTGISPSQWGVGATSAQGVIRSNANDILHYRNGTNYKIWDAYNFTPSDYLPLTGGTVQSLTVTNGLDADSITVGSIVNSDTLAEYLDADAMQTWGDDRYLKLTDKAGLFTQLANYDGALQITIGGTQKSLTIAYANAAGSANTAVNADKLDNHHAADFALASSLGNYLPLTGGTLTGNLIMNGSGVGFGPNGYYGYIDYSNSQLRIGSGTVHVQSDGLFLFNGDLVATQPWVTAQLGSYLPMTGGTVSGNLTMVGGDIYFKRTSGGNVYGVILASTVTPSGYQSAVGCITIGGNVNFDNDGAPPMAAGKWLATQEWVQSQYTSLFTQLANYDGAVQITIGGTQKSLTIGYASTAGSANTAVNADKLDNHHAADFALASALGNYLPLTGGTMAGPLNMGSYMLSFGTTAAIYYASGLAGNILVLNADNVDIMTAGGNFRWNSQKVATQTWANGQFVTVLGVSGEYLTYTKNGSTTNLTVRFAMRTMGFKRMYVTGSQIADANTMTVGGVEYALLSNYASTDLWENMPSGMSYGNVLQLTSASSLDGQLAWDSNDNVTTGVTRKLYWRSRNSTGWGTDDWHTIAFQDWVQSWVNGRGFASAQDLYDLGTLVTTGYLPLTAGSSKPLTGSLYVTPGAGTHQTVEIDGSQYKIGLTIGAGNVNRGLYGYTIGGSNDWLLYFDASNTILNYGNVGIGTTSPSKKLHVNGESLFENWVTIKGNNGIGLQIIDTNGTHDFSAFWNTQTINNVSREIFTMYSHETKYWDMSIGTHPNAVGYGGLYMYNSGNNVLRWGIGTATPDSKLHVVNECHFAGGAKFNNICIEVDNSIAASGRGSEINNYNGNLHLQYNSSTNCSICYGGGNVGIGTRSPVYKLDVNGNTGVTGSLDVSIELSVGDVTNGGVWLSDSALGVWTMSGTTRQDTELMSLASGGVTFSGDTIMTGKLAVGTTTFDGSNAKLQVGGNMFATGSITSKSNAGNVSLGNGNISANNLYISTVVFGNSNNDPAIYIGNGHVYARNSQGQTTMIV